MNSLALLDPDRFLTSTAVDSNDGQDELLITQTQKVGTKCILHLKLRLNSSTVETALNA